MAAVDKNLKHGNVFKQHRRPHGPKWPSQQTGKNMKIIVPPKTAPKIFFAALSLIAATALLSTAIAETGNEKTAAGNQAAPFYIQQFKARLDVSRLEGRVDTPLSILLMTSPDPPPSGFFYTSVVDLLDHPPGQTAEIVTGAREIRVRCFAPGSYRLRVRVNLIEKSSCGGAGANILTEEEVLLNISE